MSDKAAELTAQLRGGGSLATSRRRKLVLCGLLALMGCVLAVVGGEEDSVYVGLGALVALTGVVSFVAVVLGWQSARRTWLAREGVVFETASVRYHLPWDSISEVKLVGRSALARVQLSVRDIAEVLQTVRRKQRGGKLKAQARIRRTFEGRSATSSSWGSRSASTRRRCTRCSRGTSRTRAGARSSCRCLSPRTCPREIRRRMAPRVNLAPTGRKRDLHGRSGAWAADLGGAGKAC